MSNDNGKTWILDNYFANPDGNNAGDIPIIHKIMTDFYTYKAGTSGMIFITGEYLKSIPTPSSGHGQGNGNSTSAGQIAYQYVYHSKAGSKINTITKTNWTDINDRSYDSSGARRNYKKVNTASTVISSVQSDSSTSIYVQDHIYVIANDTGVNVNAHTSIPYDFHPFDLSPGTNKFSTYDFYNASSDVTKLPVEGRLTNLSLYLNPSSIYGTMIDTNPKEVTNTTFDAKKTTFTFMSGINKSNSNEEDNLCFIVENQHYDPRYPDEKTNPDNTSAFVKPIIIQYNVGNPDSTKEGASYIWLDA